MTGKEFKAEISKIETLRAFAELDQAHALTMLLMEHLFRERKFSWIVELFRSAVCTPPETFYTFEVAYALNEAGYVDESERVYEYVLTYDADNSVILNNLSHIKRAKHQLQEAFDLIRRAYAIVPHDEVIASNYHNLYALIQNQQQIKEKYTQALVFLADEDDVILEKLCVFLANLTRDPDFQNYRLPIPEWKFSRLMETNTAQADALLEDWLAKGYLRRTRERDEHLVTIYELNPYLQKELQQVQPKQLPLKWVENFAGVTIEDLERLSYFALLRKIRQMKPKYQQIGERDLNELFLNYLMKNEKAVIVLAGSLVEVVLLYYCEEKGFTTIYIERKNNKTEKRDLYECDLAEILQYLKEKKVLSDIFVHIGNISRIYRNFIHPGKELREPEFLNQAKAELCFLSVLEIIHTLL